MASVFVAQGEREPTQPKRAAVTVIASAALFLTLVLIGWMLAQVAEHPGVPREAGELPSWFTGAREPSSDRPATGASAAARGYEPGPAAGSGTQVARAPQDTAAVDRDYAEFSSGAVEIAFKEYELTPGRIRVRPGKVAFVLRNEGRYSHDFRINAAGGSGIDITTQKFGPGRTLRLEVTLKEGEYKISCPLSNHDERGMHGTLVVTSQRAGK